jgi:hypothetical protein
MDGATTITIALAMMIATTLWVNVHLADIDYCHACTTSVTVPLTPFSRTRAGVEKVAFRRTSATTTTLATDVSCASPGLALGKEE